MTETLTAASTIPIVFATGSDAVEVGVVDSLNRPEAKVTGTSLATAGPASMRLELLLELRPGASSLVGYLDSSRLSGAFETNVENVTTAARIKGRELLVFDAATEREVETAFIRMALRRIRMLVVSCPHLTMLSSPSIGGAHGRRCCRGVPFPAGWKRPMCRATD
jgi:putative ABC transport system substrate-binding protein